MVTGQGDGRSTAFHRVVRSLLNDAVCVGLPGGGTVQIGRLVGAADPAR